MEEGSYNYSNEGSYGCGIALGFFVGIIGLIIAVALNQPLTKKGAIHGFIARLVISGILFIVYITVLIDIIGGWPL